MNNVKYYLLQLKNAAHLHEIIDLNRLFKIGHLNLQLFKVIIKKKLLN
jgi:hypothetical protein